MDLAIGTTFDYQLPLSQQLAEIARTFFQSVSLGANIEHSGYLTDIGRKRILELSRSTGIRLDSLHVPFTQSYDLSCTDGEKRMGAVCRVAMCMAAAKELGIGMVILHLNSFPTAEYRQETVAVIDALGGLVESAEIMNIKLAAENLWGQDAKEFLKAAFTEYKSASFGFCYDSSHDQLGPGQPYEVLDKYSDRLFALHLSDNDGDEDRHWIPFSGIVDWRRICGVLKSSGYSSSLLLEVENQLQMKTEKYLSQAAEAAARLRDMILQ